MPRPEFQRLSQEFQKIAEQAQLVQAFGAASAKLDDLTAKAASAATQVDKLRIELGRTKRSPGKLRRPTAPLATVSTELKGALRQYATLNKRRSGENQTGAP